MLKAGLCSPVSIIPEKPFFVLHPSFLLNAVICLFRGQMMLFHIWLQIMFMKEECAAMSEKEIRGAVIGVTDDGYPIVTEDYSCPYFTVCCWSAETYVSLPLTTSLTLPAIWTIIWM